MLSGPRHVQSQAREREAKQRLDAAIRAEKRARSLARTELDGADAPSPLLPSHCQRSLPQRAPPAALLSLPLALRRGWSVGLCVGRRGAPRDVRGGGSPKRQLKAEKGAPPGQGTLRCCAAAAAQKAVALTHCTFHPPSPCSGPRRAPARAVQEPTCWAWKGS